MSSVILGVGIPLAQKIIESWLRNRMAATGKSRDEVIAEAEADWDKAEKNADDLRKLGHENE